MPSRRRPLVDFRSVLGDVGYQHSEIILSGPNWEYWKGQYTTPGQVVDERVLYVRYECGWEELQFALDKIQKEQRPRDYYLVLHNTTRKFGDDLERIRSMTKKKQVYSVSSFLFQAVKRAVTRPQKIDPVRHFVQQSVIFPPEGRRQPSLETVLKWLRGASHSGPSVAVLLAPAASGKTSLARETFRALSAADRDVRIPLLIEREVWKDLLHSEKVDLIDVWRSSMAFWYPGAIIGYDQLERCLSFGAISPIFDGLDELCTAFPLDIHPDDTVRSLLTLFEGSGGEGRLLITSRASFWAENIAPAIQSQVLQVDLCPFDDVQVRSFMKKRFEGNREAENRALRVLHRIGSATGREEGSRPEGAAEEVDGNGVVGGHIEQVPYVAVLAAESADTERPERLARFGKLFSGPDPVRGLLLAICERERERQKLILSAEEQIEVFAELTAEFEGALYSLEELEFCCEARGHGSEEITRLRSHWFLLAQQEGGPYAFQYPFIEDYLRAWVFCRWLLGESPCPRADQILRLCSKQPGNLLDQIATLVDAGVAGDWLSNSRVKYLDWRYGDRCLCGFFHAAVTISKRVAEGTRRDYVAKLLDVFGEPVERCFRNLRLSGSLSRLDFSGIRFVSCTFEDIEFSHCVFDEGSMFVECRFDGQFLNDYNDGFEKLEVSRPVALSPAARATFDDLKSAGNRRRIDSETVEEALRDVLRWFTRGPGFRTKKEQDIRSAARRWGRFGNAVVKRLISDQVLEQFQSAGPPMLKVEDRDGVRLFLENRLVAGRMLEVRNALLQKHTGDEIRPRM